MTRSDGVWLHLCCEGWVRFGPFEWVGIDEQGALVDHCGKVIATHDGDAWLVPEDRYRSARFRTPVITASRTHPSPNRGGFPFVGAEQDAQG